MLPSRIPEAERKYETGTIPEDLKGFPVYFVGIKGTGMSALAELFFRMGARVSGSDTEEKFYTDLVLTDLGIPYSEGFRAQNLPGDVRLVIHSAAYRPDENPELQEACRRGIPLLTYSRALGEFSLTADSSGISGVHGKTTTTAMAGTILKELKIPASVLAGSAAENFGGRSTLVMGNKYFIAETCEYRRHFLDFHPRRIVITNIEPDHLDYYKGYTDILDAFITYGLSLPEKGKIIYCADDPGAREAAEEIAGQRTDISCIPYGESAGGKYRVIMGKNAGGEQRFRLGGWNTDFILRVPGRHMVLNAAAAAALTADLAETEGLPAGQKFAETAARALESFRGSKRRSEVIGSAGGILFMDDYGHHPTEIRKTLEGLKEFYPRRRLVVDFMSHTYSRTEALLEEFGTAFPAADLVVLHKIYASAREKKGTVDGETLYRKVGEHHPAVLYIHEPLGAVSFYLDELREGDIFLTLGAGDNWTVGKEVFGIFSRKQAAASGNQTAAPGKQEILP